MLLLGSLGGIAAEPRLNVVFIIVDDLRPELGATVLTMFDRRTLIVSDRVPCDLNGPIVSRRFAILRGRVC